MKDDSAAILDDVLSRWHQWASGGSVARGYGSRSMVCGEFRVSRQYDDVNGALDDELEHATMKTVDFQVSEMRDPWRSAIHANARALVVGAAVWSSPRLPADSVQRLHVIAEAREQLAGRLLAAGVL